MWVSCEGENAADKEHIGPIVLLPTPGFPEYFFPYSNNAGYLSPLVAVWFESPVRKYRKKKIIKVARTF